MPFFRTPSNYDLHYQIHGNGANKVMLIMGFACCKSYWYPLVERLLAYETNESDDTVAGGIRNEYEICLFDSRGFGQSDDSFSLYSTSSMARDVKALLMHLRWIYPERELLAHDFDKNYSRGVELEQFLKSGSYTPPPLHIVAWSLGGMIAQELTLDLTSMIERYRLDPMYVDLRVMDFRSIVFSASSRGGIRHRADKHDASHIAAANPYDTSTINSSSSSSSSFFQQLSNKLFPRFLRKNRSSTKEDGRWRWGRSMFLRNMPPIEGLVLIFRVVFLSFYHSRIERVLDLHYSPAYLEQPYVGDVSKINDKNHRGNLSPEALKAVALPPVASLTHLPLATAALTSAARSTLELHRDARTGEFTVSQEEARDSSISSPPLRMMEEGGGGGEAGGAGEMGEQLTPDTATAEGETNNVEPGTEQVEGEVLQSSIEETMENGLSMHFTTEQQMALEKQEQQEKESLLATPGKSLRRITSPPTTMRQLSLNTTETGTTQPFAAASTAQKVLTNRDVLASQYVLRAPFDRYIVQYLYSLFGHFLSCLTHHVSRKRIAAFKKIQNAAVERGEANPLRMLVVTGTADILVHPSNSFHLSELFDCPLFVLEGIGHMIHTEEPDAFAQLLHAHFTRTPVQHLQAYWHNKQQQSPSKLHHGTMSPPQLGRALTFTQLDEVAPQVFGAGTHNNNNNHTNGSSDERPRLASRRNSFLVHIGDMPSPLSMGNGSSNSAAAEFTSMVSPKKLSRSTSRRGSFLHVMSEGAGEVEKPVDRRKYSCCTRFVNKLTSLPLSTAATLSNALFATPQVIFHHIWHPTEIPGFAFGLLKRAVGAGVLKGTEADQRTEGLSATITTQ